MYVQHGFDVHTRLVLDHLVCESQNDSSYHRHGYMRSVVQSNSLEKAADHVACFQQSSYFSRDIGYVTSSSYEAFDHVTRQAPGYGIVASNDGEICFFESCLVADL